MTEDLCSTLAVYKGTFRSHISRQPYRSMDQFQRMLERDRLQSEIDALEIKSGLSEAMKRAREGRFIPLGALGENVTPAEYFADEHDHLRSRTRDAYFSVADIEIRKKLIGADRRLESLTRRSLEEDVIAANRIVSAAAVTEKNQPWGKAALLGGALVAIGYWTFGTVGAIGGALVGFFLGQGLIAGARNNATAELAQASRQLEQARRCNAEHSLMPEFFTSSEEFSGERDKRADEASAYANILQKQRAS